jgi:hypothetical protein
MLRASVGLAGDQTGPDATVRSGLLLRQVTVCILTLPAYPCRIEVMVFTRVGSIYSYTHMCTRVQHADQMLARQ